MGSLDPGVPVLAGKDVDERIRQGQPLIVLYYGDWCGYCRVFLPDWHAELDRLPMPAVAVNMGPHGDPAWDEHRIAAVPTVIAFNHGSEVDRAHGRRGIGLSRADLEGLIERLG